MVRMGFINLDHNATTPIRPEVVDAMRRVWQQSLGNPASQHGLGQAAQKLLEEARRRVAAALGADLSAAGGDRLVFTSSATEANNLALLGIARARRSAPGQVIISAIEHQSVLEPAEHLLEQGWRLDTLSVDRRGVVAVDLFERWISAETAVVSVTLANHETGVIQPVEPVAGSCRAAGVPFHTDAVQAAGKVPIRFGELGVSSLAVGAHKFGGPRFTSNARARRCGGPIGIGALLLRRDVPIRPLMFGGTQQGAIRPGTESAALAVGMAEALELSIREGYAEAARMRRLRERFEAALLAAVPGAAINGAAGPRVPQTSNVTFPAVDGQVLLVALSINGIACSLGSACSSGAAEVSPTLMSMGLSLEQASRSLRFSIGHTNTEAEIDAAAGRIAAVWNQLKD